MRLIRLLRFRTRGIADKSGQGSRAPGLTQAATGNSKQHEAPASPDLGPFLSRLGGWASFLPKAEGESASSVNRSASFHISSDARVILRLILDRNAALGDSVPPWM